MRHKTVALPDHPIEKWPTYTVEEEFGKMYERVVLGSKGGWLYTTALHALRDELLYRGVNPSDALYDHVADPDDVEMEWVEE